CGGAAEMKVKVAAIQYPMRRVNSFDDFAQQLNQSLDDAATHQPDFVLLPELVPAQLLCICDGSCPRTGIRQAAKYAEAIQDLLSAAAARHDAYVIGGTIPNLRGDQLYNTACLFTPH